MIGSLADTARVHNAPQNVTVEEAARAFEALFLEQFLVLGNRPIAGDTLPLGGGRAERNYREMLFRELAARAVQGNAPGTAASTTSSLGLAAQVVRAAEGEEAQ